MTATEIHSCSYYCERPGCIRAQRDELRDRLVKEDRGMNHTEESLMALIDNYVNNELDNGHDVRLAIREVLAELATVKMHDQATGIQWRAQYVRAEKAEAELSFKAALVHELLPYQDRALKAEAELALLKDDNAKWKAGILNMPMKYKRMEFNAQLQRQVERAEAERDSHAQAAAEAIAAQNKAEAECERLRNDLSVHKRLLDDKIADCISWINENERLRKDAERYRWLRDRRIGGIGLPFLATVTRFGSYLDWAENAATTDAAIDAAIAQEGKK